MPVQRTIFGRPVAIPMLPRRMIALFGSIIFFGVCLVVLSADSSPSDSSYTWSGWGQAVHKPPKPLPIQANSSSGDTKWYSDWKWRNPFSSSVTLDENRALLPPLPYRPPIYTFFDMSIKRDEATLKAENELLLIWRRAWWAQGFRPKVLGRPEAMNNPVYEALQQLRLNDDVEAEMARWLAWDHMGTGILANYLALPMAPYEDDMLSFLRRGEYPALTKFTGLDNAIFCGEAKVINQALMAVLRRSSKKMGKGGKKTKFTSMIDAVGPDVFQEDKRGTSIAFYNSETIKAKYANVQEELETTTKKQSNGMFLLAQVINSHLHMTWQNTFSKGITVVKPFEKHMTAAVEPAIDLARNLTQCSASIDPKSCPPNNKKCTPCTEYKPLPINVLDTFTNDSKVFTIGSALHPYTLTALLHDKEDMKIQFIRRKTKRDEWLTAVTSKLMPGKEGGSGRVVRFKDAVASEHGAAHSLWMTAERETHKDLNWVFGFELPVAQNASLHIPKTPLGLPLALHGKRPPAPEQDGPMPGEKELNNQHVLISKARNLISNKVRALVKLRDAAEAWNLADTEAWRFARAFSARRRMERLVWEEEERNFAGAENRAKGWGGWFGLGG